METAELAARAAARVEVVTEAALVGREAAKEAVMKAEARAVRVAAMGAAAMEVV